MYLRAQVHGAHQAASHIPALNLPSRSRYSFTDHLRMDGGLSKPRPRVQTAKSNWPTVATRPPAAAGLEPGSCDRKSSTLTTRLSRHQ